MKSWFLLTLAAGLLVAAGSASARHSAAQPNILFLAVDDLRPELACYGNPFVKSPNIDALAGRGVRFGRAYCQYPLCNPSRSSLLTGRYPTTTGIMDNLKYFRDAQPAWVTLPEYFRSKGYVTARVGKIFHGGIDDQQSWVEGGEPGMVRQPRTQQQAGQYRQQSDRWVAVEGEGENQPDYRTATRAIELLEKHKGGPFFIAAGFVKPHSPLIAPKRYFDLYDVEKISLTPDFSSEIKLPEGATPGALSPNGDLFIGRPASEKEAREMIRAYYACISFVDAQVGRVLAALERLELLDNTIVVFFGDHGYHLGEMGKWSKHNSLFEEGTRVPLIFAGPQVTGGRKSPRTVELLDIYPTLTALCSLPTPDGLEGQSLVPLLKDPEAQWKHPAYSFTRGRAGLGQTVRNERYRLTVWDNGNRGMELYDYERDPVQGRNLAADPAYASALAEMRAVVRPAPP